jgi:hypothetical protein
MSSVSASRPPLDAAAGLARDCGNYSGKEILACEEAGIKVYLSKPMTSGLLSPKAASASDRVDAVGHSRVVCQREAADGGLSESGVAPNELAHNCRKQSIIAALTSDARSCWIQWPQPGSMTLPRSCGTLFAKLATTRSIPGNANAKSRSPAM